MAERSLTCVLCSNALPDISSATEVALAIFQSNQLATLKCLNLDSLTISHATKALENDYNLRLQGLYCSQCGETNELIFKLLNELEELQRKLQSFRDSVASNFKATHPTLDAIRKNSQNCRGAARNLKEIRLKIATKVFEEEPKVTESINAFGTEDVIIPEVICYDDDFELETTELSSELQQFRQPIQSVQDQAMLAKFKLPSCFVQLEPLPSNLENALGVENGPQYCLFEDCLPRTAFTVQQRNEHLNQSHGLSEQEIVALDMTVNIVPKSLRLKTISDTPSLTKNPRTESASEPHQAEQQPTYSTCVFNDCQLTVTLKSTNDFLQHINDCHGIELTPTELTSLTSRPSGSKKKKPYSCSMCAAKFRFQVGLHKHFQEFHANSTQDVVGQSRRSKSIAFLCPVVACLVKEKFDTTADRDLHVTTCHPNLNLLQQCLVCKKYLADSEALKNHLSLIHRCESLKVCEICGKQYATDSGLASHMISHDESLMLPCPHCEAKFASTSSVIYHVKRVHIQKPEFHCEHCGKGFYTGFKLNQHIICVHTDSKDIICQYCGMGFPVRSYLRRHLVKTHGAPKGKDSREKHKHRRWQAVFVKSEKPKRRSKKMPVNFKEEPEAAPSSSALS